MLSSFPGTKIYQKNLSSNNFFKNYFDFIKKYPPPNYYKLYLIYII